MNVLRYLNRYSINKGFYDPQGSGNLGLTKLSTSHSLFNILMCNMNYQERFAVVSKFYHPFHSFILEYLLTSVKCQVSSKHSLGQTIEANSPCSQEHGVAVCMPPPY